MRLFFFLFFIIFTSNAFSEQIATFKLNYVINNINQYIDFNKELEKYKNNLFSTLKTEEDILVNKKKEIEDSKLILSESEYANKISDFNIISSKFKLKIDEYNKNIQNNIETNEQSLLKELSQVIQDISNQNNISLVFSDNQYYLSSTSLDISDIIIQELNKKNIEFNIIK